MDKTALRFFPPIRQMTWRYRSYADVYEAVKAEMAVPSRLLEHVCGRIMDRLFRDFPQIEEITLKLAKRNPPMGADIEAAGVEICLSRPL